jgi:alpha-beta hydrolase superfamily lysophospholipase
MKIQLKPFIASIIAFAFLALPLPADSSLAANSSLAADSSLEGAFGPSDILAIRSDSPAFPEGEGTVSMLRYLESYSLRYPGVEHVWGFVDGGAGRVFVQGFESESSVGTLLFIHGFMDHSGCQKPLIDDALARGWAVYLMDLPGHGLSDGPSCDIADFEEYGTAASAFIDAVASSARNPARLVAAAHSTGCSALLISLLRRGDPFERVILGAPLIRSASWGWSKLAKSLSGSALRELPRGKRNDPGDVPFPMDADPLSPSVFPVHWVTSLFAWNEVNQGYSGIPGPITIIQGDKDTVVDWRYNLPYLQARMDDLEVVGVKNGTHMVFRYSDERRATVEAVLDRYLGKRLNE